MNKLILLFTIFLPSCFYTQIGGNNSFQILNLPYNARSASLGTDFISVKDQDQNLGISNPSLYNHQMNKAFGFNHIILASGINYGMLNYVHSIDTSRTLAFNFRYINYGKNDRLDEAGSYLGEFSAGDFILGAGYAKQLNPSMSIGVNVNLIYSQLESFSSFGFSGDFAANYKFSKSATFITVVAKNIGYQLKPYINNTEKSLPPTEIQIGISHKLQHAPFRFSLLAHQLQNFDLTYRDLNQKQEIDPLTGDIIEQKQASFGEKIFRHFTYQVEILLGKNLHLRSAFDYHRRQELKITERPGLSGFSFGIGMYFKRFNLDYGLIVFSNAGFANAITLNIKLNKLKK
jgi:hypothetical protein